MCTVGLKMKGIDWAPGIFACWRNKLPGPKASTLIDLPNTTPPVEDMKFPLHIKAKMQETKLHLSINRIQVRQEKTKTEPQTPPFKSDILSYNQIPGPQKELLNPPSDRDSDLTSPGSVRSELDTAKSEEGDIRDVAGPEKLLCQFPGCGRSFDRPNLLKRHIKIHSGECR